MNSLSGLSSMIDEKTSQKNTTPLHEEVPVGDVGAGVGAGVGAPWMFDVRFFCETKRQSWTP